MGREEIFGWLITVERADGGRSEIYNVAILDERQAVEAVKRVLPDRKGATVKVKSKLTKRLFEALQMQPGDVLAGAQPRNRRT